MLPFVDGRSEEYVAAVIRLPCGTCLRYAACMALFLIFIDGDALRAGAPLLRRRGHWRIACSIVCALTSNSPIYVIERYVALFPSAVT